MNSDTMAGKWKQIKGAAKVQWGKLTDDDLDIIDGRRESLVGKLQERYGMAKEEAQKKADEWLKSATSDEAHATSEDSPRQGPQSQARSIKQPSKQSGKH